MSSVENHGSTFTFVLPYKVSSSSDSDTDELSDTDHQDMLGDDGYEDDLHSGVFMFPPRTLGTLFSSQIPGRIPKLMPNSYGLNGNICDGLLEDCTLPSSNITSKECSSEEEMETSSRLQVRKTSSIVSDSDNLKPGGEQEQEHEQDRGTVSECSSTNRNEGVEDEVKHKILLVEDSRINVMVAKSMMKQLGYTIDVVSNGAEAVRAVSSNTYHLVLMV